MAPNLGKSMSTKLGPGGGVRYVFVDLLRGLALIVMVETHVVNAYLPLSARKSAFFFWLSFVNGLVAPSFLFASGFSLVLQARRQWDAWLRLAPVFWKQIRRLGFILLVAYYMHLPRFEFSKFFLPQEIAFWKGAFQVDVLQCIVVSLLVVNLLILLARTPGRFVWGAATLGLGAALATPWCWAQDFAGRMPLSLALFLNPHGVSLFPIFPWIAFVLAGSCAAHLFLHAVERNDEARFMRNAMWVSGIIILAALVARDLPLLKAWNTDFYRTSPLYVAIRLACVSILGAGLYFLEKRGGWYPRSIRLAGQESLLVYCAHLLLIFSILRQPPVVTLLGREAGYGVCFILSLALILLMIASARLWHNLKHDRPRFAKWALAGLFILNLVTFLVR
jgi:uncharacterized membrane protein